MWGVVELVARIGAKVIDFLPGRKESLRTQIDETKRQMDKLLLQKPLTVKHARRYERLATRLRSLEQQVKNN